MIMPYSYKTSSDYVDELHFDYIETYSFQRGEEFEARRKERLAEYIKLKELQRKRKLNADEENEFLRLSDEGETRYLIDSKGEFHPSSEKIQVLKRADPKIERLIGILRIEAKDIPQWMCAPVYRDAIVFYDDEGNIVSTLNICFSCEYMATKMLSEINADVKVYELLKQFFVELGLEIEVK